MSCNAMLTILLITFIVVADLVHTHNTLVEPHHHHMLGGVQCKASALFVLVVMW